MSFAANRVVKRRLLRTYRVKFPESGDDLLSRKPEPGRFDNWGAVHLVGPQPKEERKSPHQIVAVRSFNAHVRKSIDKATRSGERP